MLEWKRQMSIRRLRRLHGLGKEGAEMPMDEWDDKKGTNSFGRDDCPMFRGQMNSSRRFTGDR